MATEDVIRGIMQQNLPATAGGAFRRTQTFPLALQQAKQQIDIKDLVKRIGEAKLAAFPEELKAKRQLGRLTGEEKLATIGLRRAQTIAALRGQKQKASALEKFQQGMGRLQQFGDNDLQGRFLLGSGLSDAGFKIGGLGQFSQSGIAPPQTASLNTAMLRPHSSDQTTEEMLNEQHQIHPPIPQDLTPEDKSAVTKLDQGQDKSRNIINSILAQPEAKLGEFEKGQLTTLNKTLKEVNDTAAHAAETEKPLYRDLLKAVDKLPVNVANGFISWGSPTGQGFQALLARAQGEFVKTFHLGRMSDKEFAVLKSAVGGKNMFTSELKNLFNRQMGMLNQDIKKAEFYHDYVEKGGRNAEDAAFKWLNSIGEEGAEPQKAPTGKAQTAPSISLSDDRLAQIAQEEGIPLDVLKQRMSR